MKSKGILITLTAVVVFLSVSSHAQDARPTVPFMQLDVCPFECCQFGKWTAKSLLKVYKQEGDTSATAFTIKPGEEFTAIGGNVHVVKLGQLVLEKSFDIFIKGDKVYILSYRGEGFYDLWYKGKVLDLDSDVLDKVWANGKLVNSPEFAWWVLVKNKDGKQGWLKLRNITDSGFQPEERIDGMDSCN
jgi:hypothetical protein